MNQYRAKSFRSFGGNIKVKVDLSNYATKTDLKNVTHIDSSSFVLKPNLASLNPEVDKLVIDKLVPVPVDQSKLRYLKNDLVKKVEYDKLAAKVNNIDTNDFVLKPKYHTDKTELEIKIPDMTEFIKKTKLTELESEIPGVSSLATKTTLTAVENKIPSVSILVKKKQTMAQNLVSLKRDLVIIIMTNILLFQSLILQPLMFLMQDWLKPI